MTKKRDLEIQVKMQAKLKQSLKETDFRLLDAKMYAIGDKISHEKVDLLVEIIDNFRTKTKQKRDVALQMIIGNSKMSEEEQKYNRDQYNNGDKEESEELSTILAGDPEDKDELLI